MPTEARKAYMKEYAKKNREKIKERMKIYCEQNKEKISEKKKENYQKNKETRIESMKKYYEQNKEAIKVCKKKWAQENKDKINESRREWTKTPSGIKSNRIGNWKSRGVICEDWDALYENYINTTNCENCNVELTEGAQCPTRKALDHSHETGEFRAVVCDKCNLNILRG